MPPQLPEGPKRTEDIDLSQNPLASAEDFARVMRQLYPSLAAEPNDYRLTHAILQVKPEFRAHVVDPGGEEDLGLIGPPPPPIAAPGEPAPKPETTRLSKAEETRFQKWAAANKITDLDHPQSFYDYRGYWKSTGGKPRKPGDHFPDTFKQHGHPTFSVESQYATPNDPTAGRWLGPPGEERYQGPGGEIQPEGIPNPTQFEYPVEGLAGVEQRTRAFVDRLGTPGRPRVDPRTGLTYQPRVPFASTLATPVTGALHAGAELGAINLPPPPPGLLSTPPSPQEYRRLLGQPQSYADIIAASNAAAANPPPPPQTGSEVAGHLAGAAQGGLEMMTLLIPEGLAAAPAKTLAGLAIGIPLYHAQHAAGEALGISPGYNDLQATLGSIVGGWLGAERIGGPLGRGIEYRHNLRDYRRSLPEARAQITAEWQSAIQDAAREANFAAAQKIAVERGRRGAWLGQFDLDTQAGLDDLHSLTPEEAATLPEHYWQRWLTANTPAEVTRETIPAANRVIRADQLRKSADEVGDLTTATKALYDRAERLAKLNAARGLQTTDPSQTYDPTTREPRTPFEYFDRLRTLTGQQALPGYQHLSDYLDIFQKMSVEQQRQVAAGWEYPGAEKYYPEWPPPGAPPPGSNGPEGGTGGTGGTPPTPPGTTGGPPTPPEPPTSAGPPPPFDLTPPGETQEQPRLPFERRSRLREQRSYLAAYRYTAGRMADEMENVIYERGGLVNDHLTGNYYYVPPTPGSPIYHDVVGRETRNPPSRNYITSIMRAFADSGGARSSDGLDTMTLSRLRQNLGFKTDLSARKAYDNWADDVHRVVDQRARQIHADPSYNFLGQEGRAPEPPTPPPTPPPGPIAEEKIPEFMQGTEPPEETDEPGVSGARVEGPPGYLPGEGRIRLGGVSARGANILGTSLYEHEMFETVARELLQNALDEPTSHVVVRMSAGNAQTTPWLEVHDDGPGMTLDELETVFSNAFESGKGSDVSASGGFGIAKMAPLKGAKSFQVTSIVDERVPPEQQQATGWRRIVDALGVPTAFERVIRMKHTWIGTSETVAGEAGTERTSVQVANDVPTGVSVKSWFPMNSVSRSHLARVVNRLYSIVGHSANLPQRVRFEIHEPLDYPQGQINIRGKDVEPPAPGNMQPIETRSAPFGETVLYKPREVVTQPGLTSTPGGAPTYEPNIIAPRTGVDVHVLNNGRYAFTDTVGTGLGSPEFQLPKAVVVDMRVNIPEGQEGYPFTASRDRLRWQAQSAVTDFVRETVIAPARQFYLEAINQAFDNIPTLPGTGSVIYDVGKRYTPAEYAEVTNHPYIRGFARVVEDGVRELSAHLYPDRAGQVKKTGLLFQRDDRGSSLGGLNIKRTPANTDSEIAITVNPFTPFFHDSPENVSVEQMAGELWHLILHETTHVKVRSEGAGFTFEEVVNQGKAKLIERHYLPQLEALLKDTVYDALEPTEYPYGTRGTYRPDFTQLHERFLESRRRVAGQPDPLFDAQGQSTGSAAELRGEGGDAADRGPGGGEAEFAGAGAERPGGEPEPESAPATEPGAERPAAAPVGEGEGEAAAGAPPPPVTEEQPSLPGAESVRSTENPTPEFEAPFSLTPETAEPSTPAGSKQPTLFERLKGEEGHLILNASPTKSSMSRWLDRNRDEHGDTDWFQQAEDALRSGDPETAWHIAGIAAAQSQGGPVAATPLSGQARESARDSPPLDPKSPEGKAARARAEALLGKPLPKNVGVNAAGYVVFGTGKKLRALTAPATDLLLGRQPVKSIIDAADPQKIVLVEGNRDTQLRLYRQIADQIISSMPRDVTNALTDLLDIKDPTELAKHYTRTVSSWGRGLRMLKDWQDANWQSIIHLTEEGLGGDVIPMGADTASAFTRWFYEEATPAQIADWEKVSGFKWPDNLRLEGEQRTRSRAAETYLKRWWTRNEQRRARRDATAKTLAEIAGDNAIDRAVLQSALEPAGAKSRGTLDAVENTSRAFSISQVATMIRNSWTQGGRYGTGVLDDTLGGIISMGLGDMANAERLLTRARETAVNVVRPGTSALPLLKHPWENSLQAIYDFTAERLKDLPEGDARRTLGVLDEFSPRAATFLGSLTLEQGGEGVPGKGPVSKNWFLNKLLDPRVRNVVTVLNRVQEFTFRGMVFDATMREQLRALGHDPDEALAGDPRETLIDLLGEKQVDRMVGAAVARSLDYTFAANPYPGSIPAQIMEIFTGKAWSPLARIGYPFPRFNLVNAPRFLWDHAPGAFVIDLPARYASLLSGGKGIGRLARGMEGAQIEREFLPKLNANIGQAEYDMATAQSDFVKARVDARQAARQLKVMTRKAEQQGMFPELHQDLMDLHARLMERVKAGEEAQGRHRRAVDELRNFRAQEKVLNEKLIKIKEIGAPASMAEYWARQATGASMFIAAYTMRDQEGQEDTKWYEYKVGDHTIDLRPFAPFVQYLLPADIVRSVYKETDWDEAHDHVADYYSQYPDRKGNPFFAAEAWANALEQSYHGKYTPGALGREGAAAFLSMSPAAGLTSSLIDLVLGRWEGTPREGIVQKASGVLLGVIGQFLGRFSVPAQMPKDVIGQFSEEEAKARIPQETTVENPHITAPAYEPFLSHIPFASRAIPEKVSPLTGEPMRAVNPILRVTAGLTERERNRFDAEINRTGISYAAMVPRQIGDREIDNVVAKKFAEVLADKIGPKLLDNEKYLSATPDVQRTFISKYIGRAKLKAYVEAGKELDLTARETMQKLGPRAVEQRREMIRHWLDTLKKETLEDHPGAGGPAASAPGEPGEPIPEPFLSGDIPGVGGPPRGLGGPPPPL